MATDNKPIGAETDFFKGDTDNMVMLGHPMIDALMKISIALGAEMWAGQKRVKIIESLMEKEGKVTPDMVEKYVPSAEEQEQWAAERKAMVERVYSVMSQTTAAAAPFTSPPIHGDKL